MQSFPTVSALISQIVENTRACTESESEPSIAGMLYLNVQRDIRVSAFHFEDLSMSWVPALAQQQVITTIRAALGLGFAFSFGLIGFVFADYLWYLLVQLISSTGSSVVWIPSHIDPILPLLFGSIFGLLYGPWLTTITPDEILRAEPIDATGWSWVRAQQNLPGALLRAFSRPVWSVILVSFTFGSWAGFYFWIAFGILVGVSNALFLGIVTNQIRERVRVNSGLRRSVMYALGTGVLVLVGALTTSVLSFRASGALQAVCSLAGLLFFFASPMYGYRLGGSFCIKHLCVRLTLIHRRHIPLRFHSFLEFAVERVIMLRVGGSFRFVHREVQEHLVRSAKKATRARQAYSGPQISDQALS